MKEFYKKEQWLGRLSLIIRIASLLTTLIIVISCTLML